VSPARPSARSSLIAVSIVLVAAVAFGAWVLRPETQGVGPVAQPPPPEHTPRFAFAVGRTGALPTTQLRIRKPVHYDPLLRLRGPSRAASRHTIASITRLYREAFLDPANWRAGAYDSAWHDLASAAGRQARRDLRVMTAGAAAGEAYLSISPRPSTIRTTVLLDRNGAPAFVMATVHFRALGRALAGTSNTMFESVGTFSLEHAGRRWVVVSYDVRRSDHRVEKPLPTSSVAATPSAESTP